MARPPLSPWSFRIATVSGIPIRIHFTFVLFLVWLGWPSRGAEGRFALLLVPAIFFCVLLHELGHALTAKRFGIGIKDITLYPIGGIAMLAGRPNARQEFWITVAGPAVNLVIAGVLFPILLALRLPLPSFQTDMQQQGLLTALLEANLLLFGFNMIPAFPMDGGRILRSLLAMRMDPAKATRIAGGIGQALAVGIFLLGLLVSHAGLMLIAFFVFLGAGQEVASSVGFSLVSNRRALDAMMTQFRTIPSGASLGTASGYLLEGSQHDFPVMWEGDVQGLLARDDIVRGLTVEGPSAYVAGLMRRDYRTVLPDAPLDSVMEMFTQGDRSPILVMVERRLLGMITAENLSEFLMLEQARTRRMA